MSKMSKENPERYVINSNLLDVDYRKKHIFDLLDRYVRGEPIENSEVAQWGRRTVQRGSWFYGCTKHGMENCIQLRQKMILELYENIKTNGYNGSTISIYFDKTTGQVHTYDGFHRVSIMEYLNIDADCNCTVSYHHPTRPDMRGDFPLEDRLRELNSGQYLYEPCEDPRVKNWPVWRPDTPMRLTIIKKHLVPGSVLDVGCSCGWISRQLARANYTVTSLESNPKRLAVARYLSITQNLPSITNLQGKWQNIDGSYDNILMLSVLHHDFLAEGTEKTFQNLKRLQGRCKHLITEVPLTAESVAWLPKEKRDAWKFTLTDLSQKIEVSTGLSMVHMTYVHPARPIMVFT